MKMNNKINHTKLSTAFKIIWYLLILCAVTAVIVISIITICSNYLDITDINYILNLLVLIIIFGISVNEKVGV